MSKGSKVGNSLRVYLRDADDAAATTVKMARAEGFQAGRQSLIALLEREVYSGEDPLTLLSALVRQPVS